MTTQLNMPQHSKPVVIIGAGGIVTDSHLPAYRKAGFQVLGLYDRDYQKAQNVAGQWDIPHACQTIDELIALAQSEGCVFDIAVPASEILPILQKIPCHVGALIQKPVVPLIS